jgi:hypothetical protein
MSSRCCCGRRNSTPASGFQINTKMTKFQTVFFTAVSTIRMTSAVSLTASQSGIINAIAFIDNQYFFLRTDEAILLCQQSKRFRFWVHRLNISHYNYLNTVTRTHTKRGVQFVYNIQPAESFPKLKCKLNPPLTNVCNIQPAQSFPTKIPLWVFWLQRIEQDV